MTTVREAKDMARRLRSALTARGHAVTHSEALELIAAQFGHRDWNTACALLHPDDDAGPAKPKTNNEIVERLLEARSQALDFFAENPWPDSTEFISRIDAKISEWGGSPES